MVWCNTKLRRPFDRRSGPRSAKQSGVINYQTVTDCLLFEVIYYELEAPGNSRSKDNFAAVECFGVST